MLKIKIEDALASELRGYLFESYESINTRTRKYLKQERYALCDEAIQLRDRVLRQRNNWINLLRILGCIFF